MSKNRARKEVRRLYTENKHLRRQVAAVEYVDLSQPKADWVDYGLVTALVALASVAFFHC